MKTMTITLAALALAAGTAFAQQPAAEKKAEPAKKPQHQAVSKSATEVVTATVEAINHETREVTLKGPERTMTVVAGPEVKNLDKVQKGDTVTLKYHVGLLAEAREATAEEKANPKQVTVGGGRTMEGGKPAAGVSGQVKVVATVEKIDKAKSSITFKGPEGNTETIVAEHPENLDKVKVGDTVVFTYTEAVALSVSPAKPAAKKETKPAEAPKEAPKK